MIVTVAAWHSARRKFTSLALVIPPESSRLPKQDPEAARLPMERHIEASMSHVFTGTAP